MNSKVHPCARWTFDEQFDTYLLILKDGDFDNRKNLELGQMEIRWKTSREEQKLRELVSRYSSDKENNLIALNAKYQSFLDSIPQIYSQNTTFFEGVKSMSANFLIYLTSDAKEIEASLEKQRDSGIEIRNEWIKQIESTKKKYWKRFKLRRSGLTSLLMLFSSFVLGLFEGEKGVRVSSRFQFLSMRIRKVSIEEMQKLQSSRNQLEFVVVNATKKQPREHFEHKDCGCSTESTSETKKATFIVCRSSEYKIVQYAYVSTISNGFSSLFRSKLGLCDT